MRGVGINYHGDRLTPRAGLSPVQDRGMALSAGARRESANPAERLANACWTAGVADASAPWMAPQFERLNAPAHTASSRMTKDPPNTGLENPPLALAW
jgi:hypothetical protein